MTQSIALNAQNDIYLVNGILQFVSALPAVDQNCRCAMKAQQGEMVLNLARGVPTMAAIWEQFFPAQFEIAARQMLESVDDVETVESFTLTQIKRFAVYVAEIATAFGSTTITGDLSQ